MDSTLLTPLPALPAGNHRAVYGVQAECLCLCVISNSRDTLARSGLIPFQRWKLRPRKVGSDGTGFEPRCVQSPCPAGTQGLLQTLGAEDCVTRTGVGLHGPCRGLGSEVGWTCRRATTPHPLGFPGRVGSEMWGVGTPVDIHPWCAREFELTRVLHASTQRHHTRPLLPSLQAGGIQRRQLGGCAQEAGGRALGS